MSITISDLAPGGPRIRSTLAALAELHRPARPTTRRSVCPTGFDALDRALAGGVRPGELVLLGGKPGVGKTIAALQWARAMAAAGIVTIYLSYQHDELVLLARLLTCELGEILAAAPRTSVARSAELRARIEDVAAGAISLPEALASDPLLAEAHGRLAAYADRLVLAAGSVAHRDGPTIGEIAQGVGDLPVALFVDYVQKLPARSDASDPAYGGVAERLKRFALEQQVLVVGIAAADRAGLAAPRLRARHLRGSTALAHEPDVIIVMNDAPPGVTEGLHPTVVFSIEKNRNGAAGIDVEFVKDFAHFRFHPSAPEAVERLATAW